MKDYQLATRLLAQVQKAGARHSGSDNALIQQAHDILCTLGAKCQEAPMMTVGDLRRYAPNPMLKAAVEALVLRHPGHPNQKTHGNRFGSGQAKESLRRLKDDKGAREAYKEGARKKQGLTLNEDKFKVGSKKMSLPKSGETVSGIGPKYGDKFTIHHTGQNHRTGKGEYKVVTDKQTYNVYNALRPAKKIEEFLRFNA